MRNGPYELIVPPAEYPGKRYRGRYAYQHRVNWWRKTGKNPDEFPGTLVHHKNERKRDNDPENLALMARGDHSSHHAKPVQFDEFVCENCSASFAIPKGKKRLQRFCSRQCIGFFHGGGRRKDAA
jgi:hypothetical protein